jgi:isopenicillin-N epimerase
MGPRSELHRRVRPARHADPSAHLAAPAGIAFLRELGEDAVRQYNHQLAWEGARTLVARWGTELGMPETMVGTMATFPMPASLGSTDDDAARLRDALLYEDRIEAQIHAWRGRLWARISGQVYLEMADIDRFGEAVLRRV